MALVFRRALIVPIAYGIRFLSGCASLAMPLHAQALEKTSAVRQLRSPDWNKRAEAFETLAADSNAFASPRMAAELLRLLETEDEVIASTIRTSRGRVTVDEKYGEEFGEYDAAVLDLCIRFCDKGGLVRHILHGARPGSKTRSRDLELIGAVFDRGFSDSQRDQLTDALISGAGDSTSFVNRYSSLLAINGVLRKGLLPALREAGVRRAVIPNVTDPRDFIRAEAVEALGQLRDPRDRVLLSVIAERDTAHERIHGTVTYQVRDAARKALDKLPPP